MFWATEMVWVNSETGAGSLGREAAGVTTATAERDEQGLMSETQKQMNELPQSLGNPTHKTTQNNTWGSDG